MNESSSQSLHRPPTPGQSNKIATLPTQATSVDEHLLDPIGLVEEAASQNAEKKIRAFGIQGGHVRKDYQRKPHAPGTGACRVRTFHGKLSDQGMEYLDNAINDWLDLHPEVEVKFVTSSVGVFEGKIREPALVLNLWY